MKPFLRAVLVALLAVCAGCVSIPTSGPVVSESRRVVDENQGGITIVAEPPPQGAVPANIIRGFLTAMTAYGSDYAMARMYLTAQAGQTWSPESSVVIYSNTTTPQATDNQWTMTGSRIGYLRPDGSFVSDPEPNWRLDLGLVQEDGQWRISTPPEGVAVSQYMLNQSFTRATVYFFPESGSTLVPDTRYIQVGQWNMTKAAQLVLDGPSTWLSGIVASTTSANVSLNGEVVVSDQGVASIPLTCDLGRFSMDEATSLAIEMAATMSELGDLTRIRLLCDERPVPLAGAAADGSIPVSAVEAYYPTAGAGADTLLAVRDQVLVAIDPAGESRPLSGNWGTTPRQITGFAAQAANSQIAAVTAEGLLVGAAGGGVEPSMHWETTDLLRPQYDQQANLWAMASREGQVELQVFSARGAWSVDTTDLNGMIIKGFQVAPDGRRMVMIRQASATDPSSLELGVALITYESGHPAAIVDWRQIRLVRDETSLRSLIDVAWLGPSSLLVLGSTDPSASAGLFSTDLDGLSMEEWGMRPDWSPVAMTVHPTATSARIVVLDADGMVWVYTNSDWIQDGDQVTAVVFPS
ncbi:MAG: LpqB family beta-propeller domain-containing protein [Propionibacteriaceae bacterium]|jgi:hypothetical protein|nr:LpqB family beta-propeller domain-containing protein [Propionibacteriaceae bacterium]